MKPTGHVSFILKESGRKRQRNKEEKSYKGDDTPGVVVAVVVLLFVF